MRGVWITISGVITSVILFYVCFADPAGARSCCRDINECVNLCIDESRGGSIYELMECIGYCSRFGRRGVFDFRSRGDLRGEGLTRSECRKAARALFPQEFKHRREFRHSCRLYRLQ
jgi:hypothetical protein